MASAEESDDPLSGGGDRAAESGADTSGAAGTSAGDGSDGAETKRQKLLISRAVVGPGTYRGISVSSRGVWSVNIMIEGKNKCVAAA